MLSHFSRVRLCATPWMAAHQAPLSLGFSRQELGFIKRSFECWATSTKQLLNVGGGHQAPRKAAPSLQKEVRQNIKDKRETRVKDGDLFWGGSREGGGFHTVGNALTGGSVGSFTISEGNITGRGKKNNRQNTHLTTTVEKNFPTKGSNLTT